MRAEERPRRVWQGWSGGHCVTCGLAANRCDCEMPDAVSPLDELRADNVAAYSADTVTGDYQRRLMASNAVYIPALEAEVDRLRALVGEAPLR